MIRSGDLRPLPPKIYADLYGKIKDSNIPILVELRDWARLPESFHLNIEQQYEVMFDNRKSFNPANQKHILNDPATEYRTKQDNKNPENRTDYK